MIYKASEHLKYQIEWTKATDSEWIYCGSIGEVKFEVVFEHIRMHFTGSNFYISINRNESFQSHSEELFTRIKDFVGLKDFFIWDSAFKKVIEFNHIGVFRKGVVLT